MVVSSSTYHLTTSITIILRMIIHSAKDEPFCLRVQYAHDIDVIKTTKETQNFMQDFKRTFRVKKSMSVTRMPKQDSHYNKYYINPEQRYLKKSSDPKKNLANLQNEQFLYYNLHNDKFNNWRHPFTRQVQHSNEKRQQLSDDSIKELIKFKSHLQGSKKGRIPALIRQLTENN